MNSPTSTPINTARPVLVGGVGGVGRYVDSGRIGTGATGATALPRYPLGLVGRLVPDAPGPRTVVAGPAGYPWVGGRGPFATGVVPTGEVGAGTAGDTGAGEPVPASPAAARRATWPSADAAGNRAAGSLAMARSTIVRTGGGMSAGSGGGCSRTCFIAISSGLSPSNGRRPARHW